MVTPRIKTTEQPAIRCVVFSKGKPEMTYTGTWLKRSKFCGDHVVYVVSDGDNVSMYQKVTGCRVVVAEGTRSLSEKRRWAVEHLTTEDEPWLYYFEDNIKRVTCVDEDKYHIPQMTESKRAWFHTRELTAQEVLGVMDNDTSYCQMMGVNFGGYSNNDNHFFRWTKYRTVAFVWSKMGYVSRRAPQWPTYCREMDDYAMTAECLRRDGRVLVNNYLYPWCAKYEGRGGSRTLEERAWDKRMAIDQMMMRFPGLFRVKDRKGRPEGAEIQLRFHSEKQVDNWRKGEGGAS